MEPKEEPEEPEKQPEELEEEPVQRRVRHPVARVKVAVYWRRDEEWYNGTMLAVNKNGTRKIKYDDGEILNDRFGGKKGANYKVIK